MKTQNKTAERAKIAAAESAVRFVDRGMRVGLGSGSTAEQFVRCLGGVDFAREGEIICVATSQATADLALEYGLSLAPPNSLDALDIAVDGADEIDPEFYMIKGGGGALLREKIVAASSNRFVIIADESKSVQCLGQFPLPVEISRFGWWSTRRRLAHLLETSLGIETEGRLRMVGDAPFVSDENNYILDLPLGRVEDPQWLCDAINRIPGVMENGLFTQLPNIVLLGRTDGSGRVEERRNQRGQKKYNAGFNLPEQVRSREFEL